MLKVLAVEPENAKAIFRRGAAYSTKNDIDNARRDLDRYSFR